MTISLRPRAAALCLSLLVAPGAALAGPAIVVDASTGQVLHADQATDPWYPASTTKLMTAYVALRMIADGRASPDTPLVVSVRAASARPSKMGFRPGTELTLDNALKMMMVKSANDVAVVIAEGLGGSVENFAAMMNREAQRIGMRESRFVNPNGWHDPGNQTSARDLAILARAALRDFPDYRELWGIGAFQLGQRVYRNTNGLIGRYDGTTGMKTGFVCASGFNVVATASRGGRTLIAVVLGASSGSERTALAAELFDKTFASWGGGTGTVEALPMSASATAPNMREEICGSRRKSRGPLFEEEDAAIPIAASAARTGDNDMVSFFHTQGLAPGGGYTRASRAAMARGPRAEFVPIRVFIGRAPGSDTAPNPRTEIAKATPKPEVPAATLALAPTGKPQAKPATPPGLADKPIDLRAAGEPSDVKGKGKVKAKVAAKVAPTAKPRAAAAKPVKPKTVVAAKPKR